MWFLFSSWNGMEDGTFLSVSHFLLARKKRIASIIATIAAQIRSGHVQLFLSFITSPAVSPHPSSSMVLYEVLLFWYLQPASLSIASYTPACRPSLPLFSSPPRLIRHEISRPQSSSPKIFTLHHAETLALFTVLRCRSTLFRARSLTRCLYA
jgi:hypothetical protein